MNNNVIKNNDIEIGKKIKKARKKLELDQGMLAEKMGVNSSYISNVESGRTSLSLKSLAHFAEILNQPIQYFFEWENPLETGLQAVITANQVNDLQAEYKVKSYNIESISSFLIQWLGRETAGRLALLIMDSLMRHPEGAGEPPKK